MIDRRTVLANALGLAGTAFLPPLVGRAHARAEGYRALVCLFLDGGLDGDDVLIPYDQTSYDAYAEIRAPLHAAYAVQDRSRARADLLPLTGDPQAPGDGRAFAMPPELPRLAGLFDAQRAAVVANVGPLEEPTTADAYARGAVRLPRGLFSHVDQRREQVRLAGTSVLSGWGGRTIDALSGLDRDAVSALTAGGADPFWLYGGRRQPLTVPRLDPAPVVGDTLYGNPEAARLYREHLLDAATTATGPFASDYARRQAEGVAAQNRVAAAFAGTDAAGSWDVAGNAVAGRLAVVARSIALRDVFGIHRQVFYVGLSGFDTHQDQANGLLPRLEQVDAAIGLFTDWLTAEGLFDQVTLFTASDFGRTLRPNTTGTDHGWGGHQIVVGGAVRGGRVLGTVPPAALGHDQDAGRGRAVPTTATEQMAVPLARWMGLAEADLPTVFPRADRFDLSAIDLF